MTQPQIQIHLTAGDPQTLEELLAIVRRPVESVDEIRAESFQRGHEAGQVAALEQLVADLDGVLAAQIDEADEAVQLAGEGADDQRVGPEHRTAARMTRARHEGRAAALRYVREQLGQTAREERRRLDSLQAHDRLHDDAAAVDAQLDGAPA